MAGLELPESRWPLRQLFIGLLFVLLSLPVAAVEYDLEQAYPAQDEADRRERYGVPLDELDPQSRAHALRVIGIIRSNDVEAFVALFTKNDQQILGRTRILEVLAREHRYLVAVGNQHVRVLLWRTPAQQPAMTIHYPKGSSGYSASALWREGRRYYLAWNG